MADTGFGKIAEQRLRAWLDRPQDGYSMDRIPDQLSGFYMVSRNICDFVCYKYPYIHYIESKCTYSDRFSFNQLTDVQRNGLLQKSKIPGCHGLVVVLFAAYKRAFVFDIRDIAEFSSETGSTLRIKSVNIKKIDRWTIPYKELQTIPSRKELLDYTGDIEDYLPHKYD